LKFPPPAHVAWFPAITSLTLSETSRRCAPPCLLRLGRPLLVLSLSDYTRILRCLPHPISPRPRPALTALDCRPLRVWTGGVRTPGTAARVLIKEVGCVVARSTAKAGAVQSDTGTTRGHWRAKRHACGMPSCKDCQVRLCVAASPLHPRSCGLAKNASRASNAKLRTP